VGVLVGSGLVVGVADGLGVGVGVDVLVGSRVFVGVLVGVGVTDGLGVGVGVTVHAASTSTMPNAAIHLNMYPSSIWYYRDLPRELKRLTG